VKQLSGVVISFNEEARIGTAIRSLREVCDDLVMLDAFSTDRTVEIGVAEGARVFQQPWLGFVAQKQAATDLARFDWVLSLDADEKLSPGLVSEIKGWKLEGEGAVAGYRLPRLTYFGGRWIRHTTWYPDYQLRLFRRTSGRWEGGRVHEGFRIDGPAGQFQHPLLHFTYTSVSEYLRRLEVYSRLAAEDSQERGVRSGPLQIVLNPLAAFLKNYILKAGFRDRTPGLVVSLFAAVSVGFKYIRLWEMERFRKSGPTDWDSLE